MRSIDAFRGLLTPREWRVLGRILGIALFLLLVVQAGTLFDSDAGRFIYGRF